MPAYGVDQLNEPDLDDLVRYLGHAARSDGSREQRRASDAS